MLRMHNSKHFKTPSFPGVNIKRFEKKTRNKSFVKFEIFDEKKSGQKKSHCLLTDLILYCIRRIKSRMVNENSDRFSRS
ncbi:MAG: hypothetical protein B6244_12040 [Candidatus Cloacimonetes bacterium 4572_55]|nr:MAG: hypothetical protein B6244_12040 [Candidatus Cloacimonetes bacterium 4572_55]